MTKPVSFEIARLLKEKGFDLPCYHYYYNNKLDSSSKDDWNALKGYSAPTIAEVVMWFYEKHKIWIWVSQEFSDSLDFSWRFRGDYGFSPPIGAYKSPTKAYEAALKYCLENLNLIKP